MLEAAWEGWYPRQRDPGGTFAWMRDGGGFYQSPSGLSSDFSMAEEIFVHGQPILDAHPPDDWENELGGAIHLDNNSSGTFNTAKSVRWLNIIEILPVAGDTFDEWTFACVLGPANFGSTFIRVREVFRMYDGVNTPIQFLIGNLPEKAVFATDNSADVLQVNVNATIESTVVWVILQRPDGTKEIWQDGLLLASQVHLMSPNIFNARLEYGHGGPFRQSSFAFSGPVGTGVFSTRAWTEDQISDYSADPYGHHRELRQQVSFPICLDASLGVSPVLDADLGTSLVLDASLGSAPVLDADIGASPVLDADLGTSLVLDADLRVCDKGG